MPCSAEIEPSKVADDVVHGLVHRPIEREEGVRVGADRLRNIVVQIAVAHVAEADEARAGARPLRPRLPRAR